MKNEMIFSGERVVPNRTCHPQTFAEHLVRYAFAMRYAKVGSILDVACGSGYGMKLMSLLGAVLYGADIDEEAVKYADEFSGFKVEKIDFEKDDLFDFYFGRIVQTDINLIKKFDLITSFETIEHLDDPNLFLKGIQKVISDNGKFIYSIPLQCPNNFHKVVYTFESAYELISKYFEHEEMYVQEGIEIVNFSRMNGNIAGLNKRGVFIIGVCHKKK